ncbi:hypothetical protein ACDH50_08900 [Xanthomonas fragariae]|nr:hypothetical protein [Xanthomonas fragariae]
MGLPNSSDEAVEGPRKRSVRAAKPSTTNNAALATAKAIQRR